MNKNAYHSDLMDCENALKILVDALFVKQMCQLLRLELYVCRKEFEQIMLNLFE